MQGQSDCLSDSSYVTGAFEYKWLGDSIVPLKNPVGEDITYDLKAGYPFMLDTDQKLWLDTHVTGSACYGHTNLVPQFCRSYLKYSGNGVMAVHIAKGSTTIDEWIKDSDGYGIILKKASAAIAKAKEEYTIGKIFFVWLQGESDAIAGNSKEYYKEKLTELCGALKKDLNIDKFGIIRVGIFTNDSRDDEIISAQSEICGENKDFLMLTEVARDFIQIPEYMHPGIWGHYSAKGLETLGRLAGEALGKYAYISL